MTGLRVEALSFWYRTDDAPTVYDCTFSVPQGAFVAIVGESGSGKSTLLRLAAGLLPAQLADQPSDHAKLKGAVLYEEHIVMRPRPEFAFVPQNFQAGFCRRYRHGIIFCLRSKRTESAGMKLTKLKC